MLHGSASSDGAPPPRARKRFPQPASGCAPGAPARGGEGDSRKNTDSAYILFVHVVGWWVVVYTHDLLLITNTITRFYFYGSLNRTISNQPYESI